MPDAFQLFYRFLVLTAKDNADFKATADLFAAAVHLLRFGKNAEAENAFKTIVKNLIELSKTYPQITPDSVHADTFYQHLITNTMTYDEFCKAAKDMIGLINQRDLQMANYPSLVTAQAVGARYFNPAQIPTVKGEVERAIAKLQEAASKKPSNALSK